MPLEDEVLGAAAPGGSACRGGDLELDSSEVDPEMRVAEAPSLLLLPPLLRLPTLSSDRDDEGSPRDERLDDRDGTLPMPPPPPPPSPFTLDTAKVCVSPSTSPAPPPDPSSRLAEFLRCSRVGEGEKVDELSLLTPAPAPDPVGSVPTPPLPRLLRRRPRLGEGFTLTDTSCLGDSSRNPLLPRLPPLPASLPLECLLWCFFREARFV